LLGWSRLIWKNCRLAFWIFDASLQGWADFGDQVAYLGAVLEREEGAGHFVLVLLAASATTLLFQQGVAGASASLEDALRDLIRTWALVFIRSAGIDKS
jgi:hypothetical protein